MHALQQLAWCVVFLGLAARGLTQIVGFDAGRQFSERAVVLAVLVLIGARPLSVALLRLLPHPSLGNASLGTRLDALAHHPLVLALIALVVFGHVVFLVFVLRLRARLRQRTSDRSRPQVRGRERFEPQQRRPGGRS